VLLNKEVDRTLPHLPLESFTIKCTTNEDNLTS